MTWKAKWLGGPVERRGTERWAFGRTLFRSSLTVAGAGTDDGYLRVSADSHYVMYVNGVEIARGPGRSQPRRKTHDRIDLAGVLRPGKNVLACVVTYFGRSNALWQRPVPSGELGAGAALIVDGRVEDQVVGTELVWQVRESSAWTELPGGKLDGVPSVAFDARELDPSWMQRDDDEDAWEVTSAVNAAHRGWMTGASPPAAPFGALPEARRVASVVPRKARLDAIVVSSATLPDAPHPCDHLTRLAQLDWGSARSGGDASRVTLAEDQVLVIRADHERVVKGTFHADLEAPRGTTMDVAFSEQVDGPRDPLSSRSGHRYVARGYDDHVETYEAYGMRAAFLVVRPPSAGTVAVSQVSVSERLRPWALADRFRSDDPGLARLWNAGVRTTSLNSDGGFTDCPTREQRAWVGDGVVHAGVHLVANDDWSAVEEHLWLTDSPREDGILPMSVAGDLEHRDGVTIPTWSLHWVHTVWSFFMHAGIERVRPHLPTVRRILAWFAERQRGSGLLGETGEWDLVDWSAVYVRGDSGAVTALWVRALREFADMCREASDEGSRCWAASLADRASEAFELLWQPVKGLYADFRADGLPM
ncbi:MAG: alpha-L-rhamnosidase-related protein, partial [Microbacterium sp.]